MSISILDGGIFSQIQDLGRVGHGHSGFSQGGPMDLPAACWANYLLDNNNHCAVIEITLGQLSLQFNQDTVIALCGADMAPRLNKQALVMWQAVPVKAGDMLSMKTCQAGMRAYLAIKGGFVGQKVLGSVASVMRDRVGGVNQGQPLQKGDEIEVNSSLKGKAMQSYNVAPERAYQRGYHYTAKSWAKLAVFKGPQWHLFSQADQDLFLNQYYRLEQSSNRMAASFAGTPLTSGIAGIVSQGITLGAIQVPPSGLPVALLNDRQTLGGYAKIANLSQGACWRLAQLPPGCQVQFELADITQAQQQVLQFQRFFQLN
ncbi:biotin-dependent carboxyltransferase family protein [Motilimonas eburnea]|uniref:5-oxoprolinase subunit C family protein n=1 Tax=Motilimonas eburnea TaxID=1737488 RepID=UPI001E5066B8|nr:biotin-dependent carboxyltransferase family protein [Motilimonas eburnea]